MAPRSNLGTAAALKVERITGIRWPRLVSFQLLYAASHQALEYLTLFLLYKEMLGEAI